MTTGATVRSDSSFLVIAEDSPTQADRLRYLLESDGHEVAAVRNGRQALALARTRRPSLVITDIVMPEMDGYDLCRAIRSDPVLAETPVVLLTSLTSPLDVVKGLECGADNFLRKPYEDAYLLSRVRHILTNRELRRTERMQMGVEIYLGGQRHFITSERQQILDLLISTYEQAVQINEELKAKERDLTHSYAVLNGIYRIAEGLNRAATEKEVVDAALERVTELPGIRAAWLLLRDATRGFRLAGARGLPPALQAAGALEGDCRCLRALSSGQLERAANVLECERLQKATGDTEGLRHHASIPLSIGGRLLGVLNLAGEADGLLADQDLELYGVGNEIAAGLERAYLYAHLEDEVRARTAALAARARQQAAVARLGHTALEGRGVGELLQAAAEVLAETLQVEYAKVLELLPDGRFLLRAGVGWRQGCVGEATIPAASAGFALHSAGPLIYPDLTTETRFVAPPLLRDHGVVSGLCVVIAGKSGRFGLLGVDSRTPRAFSEDDVHFLQAIANVLAAAREREEAERARGRLVTILEATTDMVATADPEGRALYLNPAGRRLMGIPADEAVSSLRLARAHPEWALEIVTERGIPSAIRDGAWSGETALLHRDGREIPVSQVILAHRGPDGGLEFLSTIVRDVSEQRQLEAQLRQSQKMEAVGRLAGGVAHDFNNLLMAIMGYADLMRRRLVQGDPLEHPISEVLKAGERATGLTRQLLAFGRKQVLNPKVLDLNSVVADTESMLRRLIREDVELTTVLAGDLGRVKADPGQIEQVIVNLAVNARDAMPRGGSLTLETANVDLGDEYAGRHLGVRPGPYVMLAVTDTGVGMDEETQAHAFEPFYTTKETGKGTGLGLATVYGIAKQSGGNVWVYSEPGHGTTFKVYLPRVDEAAEPMPLVTPAAEAPRGSETVLVVEDEEAVRELILEVLAESGYCVLPAASGPDALTLAERREGPIHAVITDMIMPRMTGAELVEQLSKSRPGIRALFMSGYTRDTILRTGGLGSATAFLQKPFSPDALVRRLRQLLDAEIA